MAQPLPFPEDRAIDLASNNWVLKWSGTFTAVFAPDGKSFTPIPLQEIPIFFNSPVISCTTATTTIVNPFFMGTLIQAHNIGINEQLSNHTSRSLYAGTRTIIWRKDLNPPYRLRFKPYRKMSQVSLIIYELN